MKTFRQVLSETVIDSDVSKIHSELNQFFKRTSGVTVRNEDPSDWRDAKVVLAVGARHWGKWNVPDGEEDDGDYDWEVLDNSSASMLRNFLKQLEAKHPKYSITFGTEEKNWIIVLVKKK